MRALSIGVGVATLLVLAGCCCPSPCDADGATAQAAPQGGGARTAKRGQAGDRKDQPLIVVDGIQVARDVGEDGGRVATIKMHTPVTEWVERTLFFPAGEPQNYVRVIIRDESGAEDVVDMPITNEAEWKDLTDKLCGSNGLTVERACTLANPWTSIDVEYNFLFHTGVDSVHGKSEHKMNRPQEQKPKKAK